MREARLNPTDGLQGSGIVRPTPAGSPQVMSLRARGATESPTMPLAPAEVEAMDRHLAVLTDAFLKRFESLVSQLQDQVWPLSRARTRCRSRGVTLWG